MVIDIKKNILVGNDMYNKGCILSGITLVMGINGLSLLLKVLFEGLGLYLPTSILTVWGIIWFVCTVVAVHVFTVIKSKGFLRFFYLISLWFLQSYFIGAVVHLNINTDICTKYTYIAVFFCIVLISYCIFFSPILFLKLNIDPRSNVFFRILDDLNRNFDGAQHKECTEEDETDDFIGAVGISETILRPTGRGRFNNHSLQITTRGEFISTHIPIKIIQKTGGLHLVEEYAEGNNEQRGQDIT